MRLVDHTQTKTGVACLLFRTAFDTFDHSFLLDKIKAFNIIGVPHTSLKNYLSNPIQSVNYSGTISYPMTITVCIPQGSISGPLLFDLPSVVSYPNVHLSDADTFLSFIGNQIPSINTKMTMTFPRLAAVSRTTD